MKTWNKRPREIRTLFNPAFCGLLIARGIEGFYETAKHPMPFSLTLLILPLCLHKQTRNIFKSKKASYFTKTMQEHPEIRVEFAKRARSLFPYAMEAFAYLISYGVVTIDISGSISVNENTVRKLIKGTQDAKDCQTIARVVGRKFGQLNNRVTIYATLGIKP